jgi:hypothetical protein
MKRLHQRVGTMNRFAMFLSTVLPLVMAAEIGAQAPTAVCVKVHRLAIGRFFGSNGGDGTLTVVKEESPGRFAIIATIPTQPGARTMALDPKTHRIYLSAATYAPTADTKKETKTAAAGKGAGRGRNIVPGSFVVLVVGD